jgi:hypothetical protein
MLDEKTFAIGGPVECVSRRQIGTGSSFGFLGAYPVSGNVWEAPVTTGGPSLGCPQPLGSAPRWRVLGGGALD